MTHSAYFYAGESEAGIAHALSFSDRSFGLGTGNSNVVIERYGLFSVDDARRLISRAQLAPISGDKKVFIISAHRLFHEAQNTMLKLFEEPPPGTVIILVIPSAGNLIATLRSRLQPLPVKGQKAIENVDADAFIRGNAADREKVIETILTEAKSDDEDEKLEARSKALRLAEALSRASYGIWREPGNPEIAGFLRDLDRLIPILHDRAAPLKPILEHLLITAPKKLH